MLAVLRYIEFNPVRDRIVALQASARGYPPLEERASSGSVRVIQRAWLAVVSAPRDVLAHRQALTGIRPRWSAVY